MVVIKKATGKTFFMAALPQSHLFTLKFKMDDTIFKEIKPVWAIVV